MQKSTTCIKYSYMNAFDRLYNKVMEEGMAEIVSGVAKGIKPWTGGEITDLELKRAVTEINNTTKFSIYQDLMNGAGDEEIAILMKALWEDSTVLDYEGKTFENGQMLIYALENQPGTAKKIANYLNTSQSFLDSYKLYKDTKRDGPWPSENSR